MNPCDCSAEGFTHERRTSCPWPTAEEDPDLRAFGPGLMHTQRIDASIAANLGAGGVVCPVCEKPIGEFCCGGIIPPYSGDPDDDVCRACNGTGGGPESHLRCPTCEGTGFLQANEPETPEALIQRVRYSLQSRRWATNVRVPLQDVDDLIAALENSTAERGRAHATLWKIRDECVADQSAPKEFRERIWTLARERLENP